MSNNRKINTREGGRRTTQYQGKHCARRRKKHAGYGRFLSKLTMLLLALFLVRPTLIADGTITQEADAAGTDTGFHVSSVEDLERAYELEGIELKDEPVPLSSIPDVNSPEPEILETLDVPTDNDSNNGFKSYMDYKMLTSKTSDQYAMQQDAWTDENGLRRYGDYYMVALGTYYAKSCGETFLITLDSGISFEAITGDIKDDKDTDSLHQHRNGCIVEFIVETKALSKTCRVMGDISHAGFPGQIESIQRITNQIES